MDQSILSSKALLVRVKVGGWRASCTDDEASEIVAGQTGADADSAGRYVKKLVAKEALSDVRNVQQKARAYHESNTLPWTDNVRLLPIDKFDAYDKQMNRLSAKIQELASTLANDLEKWKSEAKERLGSLYDDGDYPTPSDLQERFYISHRFEQIPDVKHFVADLADADRERVAEGHARTDRRTHQGHCHRSLQAGRIGDEARKRSARQGTFHQVAAQRYAGVGQRSPDTQSYR